MDWIPYNKTMQLEKSKFYIVTRKTKDGLSVDEAMYIGEKFLLFPNANDIKLEDVTAVIPWPKPYK